MTSPHPSRRLSIAPMMERSDRPFRLMMRAISRHAVIYTEMVTTQQLLRHRAGPYHQPVDPREHPVALQLGGDDPKALAECAHIGQELGYDEINLNVGCPSSRVQKGRIGAVLMREPSHVAQCLASMRARVRVPVTVKHRLGVDQDPDEALFEFVDKVIPSGVTLFTVHARKAWLEGLSPKQNRSVPPLRYELVHELAKRHPTRCIELNGGLTDLKACKAELGHVGSVMVGRAAWDHPMHWAQADATLFEDVARPAPTRSQVIEAVLPALEATARERAWSHALRPILNLFHGTPGARAYKRTLSEGAAKRSDPSLRALVARALAQTETDD